MKIESLADDADVIRLLKKALRGPNYLTKVIRAHHTIELLARCVLSDTIELELLSEYDRMSFSARVELGVVLGVIRRDSLALFKGLKRIRNRFAHNPFYWLARKDTKELKSSYPKWHVEMIEHVTQTKVRSMSDEDILEWSVIAICVERSKAGAARVRSKIAASISSREQSLVLESLPEEFKKNVLAKHEAEVAERLKKVDWSVGELLKGGPTEANQALEPTTPGVTPAADAPVAPPGVVAQL